MATEPILAALDVAVRYPRSVVRSSVLSDYWALTKPEINFLIAFTTAAGFWMGAPATLSHFPWASLFQTLLGTVLVSSGAATLNQLIASRFHSHREESSHFPLYGSEPLSPFLAQPTWHSKRLLWHLCCRFSLCWDTCS